MRAKEQCAEIVKDLVAYGFLNTHEHLPYCERGSSFPFLITKSHCDSVGITVFELHRGLLWLQNHGVLRINTTYGDFNSVVKVKKYRKLKNIFAEGTKMHAEFEMDMAALTEGIAQDPALFDINVLNIHYFIESIKGVMRNVYNSELKILTHEGIDVPMSSQANALNNACRLLDFIAREPRETYYIGELIEQEVLDSDKWKTYWDACTDIKKRMENAGIPEYLIFSSGKQMTIQINPKYL